MMLKVRLLVCLLASLLCRPPMAAAAAAEDPFPLLPGLEDSVEFWRLAFTRYGASEVIFHDPTQPMKIYQVVRVEEGKDARRVIKEEREKILKEHGFKEDEKRVRAQSGVKERFAAGIKQSRKYLDQMQRIFREEGLPVELAYLPLIESSFDIRARSTAGALGMWQFMRSTGKRFLHIGSGVDERRDPLESTRAAARLLKEHYEVFGNWPLAITAYNHGRAGMLRAVSEVDSKDLVEIIRRYQSPTFGFASKSFYAEFLAALDVAKKWEQHFPGLEIHPPFPLEELQLARSVSIAVLLRPTDVTHSEFLEWNPALDQGVRDLPKGYRVKVPPEKLESFVTAYQRIAEPPRQKSRVVPDKKGSWVGHRVAPGESLSEIAERYRTSVSKIQQANDIADSETIIAGQVLKIPKR